MIAVLIALPIALAILLWLGYWVIGVIEKLLPFWLRAFLGPPWDGEAIPLLRGERRRHSGQTGAK